MIGPTSNDDNSRGATTDDDEKERASERERAIERKKESAVANMEAPVPPIDMERGRPTVRGAG